MREARHGSWVRVNRRPRKDYLCLGEGGLVLLIPKGSLPSRLVGWFVCFKLGQIIDFKIHISEEKVVLFLFLLKQSHSRGWT